MIPKIFLILFIILSLTSTIYAQSEGEDLFFRNRFPKAIDNLSQSQKPESQYLLGLSHLRMGLFYREIYSHLVPLCMHYYELLNGLGQFVESTEQSKYIDSKYIPYYLGWMYYLSSESPFKEGSGRSFYRSAKKAFNEFLAQKDIPLNFRAYSQIALAAVYYRMGDTDECDKLLAKAQKLANRSDTGVAVSLELAVTRSRLFGSTFLAGKEIANSIDQKLNEGERHLLIWDRQIANRSDGASSSVKRRVGIRYQINVAWMFYQKYDSNFLFRKESLSKENTKVKENFDLASAYRELKSVNLAKPILADRLDEILVIEFCNPIIFDQMADIYFANANAVFEKLLTVKKSDIPIEDIRYASSLSLYQLGNYDFAISQLKSISDISEPNILSEFARILLGACYYKQGNHEKAESLWENISQSMTNSFLLSVELASTYTELGIHTDKAVALCENAIPIFTEKLHSKDRKDQDGLFVPPLDAFSQLEFYIRAGRALLKAGKLDRAITTYKMAQDPVYMNVVDAQGWGNDPMLLIDLAFAYYKRGYNTYNSTTETYSLMQKFYPEIYHLHTTMQGIFVIEHNIHEKEEKMRKGK